jgi:hypothetical protein
MRASLLLLAGLTVLSIAPANAAPATKTQPWVGCSISAGTYSSTCRNPANYKTYNECKAAGTKVGWKDTEIAWYCSSLALK